MKKLLIAIAILFSISASSQSFDGVAISGDIPTAVSKYKAKGYSVIRYFEQGVQMKGRAANRDIELYVFTTPKSKKIFKMVVYFDTESSWYGIKSTYDAILQLLTNKYGTPDEDASKFITPYYLGDGYELQAVGLEKVDFHAYWFRRDNLTVGLEMSKYKQVKITYENNIMMDLKEKEQSELERNSF